MYIHKYKFTHIMHIIITRIYLYRYRQPPAWRPLLRLLGVPLAASTRAELTPGIKTNKAPLGSSWPATCQQYRKHMIIIYIYIYICLFTIYAYVYIYIIIYIYISIM